VSGLTAAAMVFCGGLIAYGVLSPGPEEDPKPARYAALSPADPVRLAVPSLGVRASVVPVALSPDAVLDPPAEVDTVGWWDASARPGADRGQTVITGHTVHTGGGALDRLAQVEPGAKVDVVTGEGRMRYRVSRVVSLDRTAVAEQSAQIFGQGRTNGRLVLVSCTDWNGTDYERNVVVYGTPLGEPRPV